MAKLKFEEIAKAKVKPTRNVVISREIETDRKTGKQKLRGYILAQQMEVLEGDKPTRMFLRGGIEVGGIKNLEFLRDALTLAIQEEKKRLEEQDDIEDARKRISEYVSESGNIHDGWERDK